MYLDRRALDRAGITDPVLRESYEFCRRLVLAVDGKQAWWAALLFPARKRPHAWALYGLIRYVDQIVDTGDRAEREELFDGWYRHLLEDLRNGRSGDPLCRAVLHTARAWGIEVDEIGTLLEGWRVDLAPVEFPTYADLTHYWACVPDPSSRILLRLLEPASAKAEAHMVALGRAIQLTSFVRDIIEDHERGRLYLPLEDLKELGVSRRDLARRSPTPGMRKLVQRQVNRARELFDHGLAVTGYLRPRSAVPLRQACGLYTAILDEIERRDYDVFTTRPALTPRRKVEVLLREPVLPWVMSLVRDRRRVWPCADSMRRRRSRRSSWRRCGCGRPS